MTFCLGQIRGAQSTIQSTDQMRYLMTGGICVHCTAEHRNQQLGMFQFVNMCFCVYMYLVSAAMF